MKVITFMNCKGGAGKTTLCTNLARAIQLDDDPSSVMLVDCDSHTGNLSDWFEGTEGKLTGFGLMAAHGRQTLLGAEDIARNNNAGYMFIDTPANVQPLHGAALAISDLVVVPLRASPLDAWAAMNTIQLIRTAQATNTNLKAMFIINQVRPTSKLTRESVQDLEEFKDDFYTCRKFVSIRESFPEAINQGKTVYEIKPRTKLVKLAIKDIDDISTELLQLLWSKE